jgi:hypothetical protein
VQANGPLVAMNGDAAGWRGLYPPAEGEKPGWFNGRDGAGVSIVLDVVPTQLAGPHGWLAQGGALSSLAVAKHFRMGRPYKNLVKKMCFLRPRGIQRGVDWVGCCKWVGC